jgi:hypothetical protein
MNSTFFWVAEGILGAILLFCIIRISAAKEALGIKGAKPEPPSKKIPFPPPSRGQKNLKDLVGKLLPPLLVVGYLAKEMTLKIVGDLERVTGPINGWWTYLVLGAVFVWLVIVIIPDYP